jgi:hypothetical protein
LQVALDLAAFTTVGVCGGYVREATPILSRSWPRRRGADRGTRRLDAPLQPDGVWVEAVRAAGLRGRQDGDVQEHAGDLALLLDGERVPPGVITFTG